MTAVECELCVLPVYAPCTGCPRCGHVSFNLYKSNTTHIKLVPPHDGGQWFTARRGWRINNSDSRPSAKHAIILMGLFARDRIAVYQAHTYIHMYECSCMASYCSCYHIAIIGTTKYRTNLLGKLGNVIGKARTGADVGCRIGDAFLLITWRRRGKFAFLEY